MSGQGRAPRISERLLEPTSRAVPAESGLQPTRRVPRVSAATEKTDASVEFPLRVHDANRLEQLVAEYARAEIAEVPEIALRAIATRRDWLRAERTVDAVLQRWEETPLPGGARIAHRAKGTDGLTESALRLRAALSEVHSAVSHHAALGHVGAEPAAWEHLRGAYEWLAVVFGDAPVAAKAKRSAPPRRAGARRPKA